LHFPPNLSSISAILHDTISISVSWFLAYWLRFTFNIPPSFFQGLLLNMAWVLPVQALLFFIFGLYQGVWRFSSTPDLKRILKAVGIGALLVAGSSLMLQPFGIISRSVFLLHPIFLLIIIGGMSFCLPRLERVPLVWSDGRKRSTCYYFRSR